MALKRSASLSSWGGMGVCVHCMLEGAEGGYQMLQGRVGLNIANVIQHKPQLTISLA